MAKVKDIRATIAPFYATQAEEFLSMPKSERLRVRENFFHNARILAKLVGLPFNTDMSVQNVGGFLNEHET